MCYRERVVTPMSESARCEAVKAGLEELLMLGELDAAWQALYSPPMSEEKRVSIRRRAEEIVREALEGPEEGEIDVAAPGNPIEEKTDCCVVEAFMDLKREDGSAAKVREVKARVDDGSVCGQLMHLLLSNLGLEALLEEDGE